jgi:glycosyltransferase involved in cell wall biosynthesis
MHIGVSGWRLSGQRLGVARYTEYLLKHWNALLNRDEQVTVYANQPLEKNFLGLSDQFTVQVIQPKLTNALWENFLLPRHAMRTDVLFGPTYTLPILYRGKCVVANHSVDEARKGIWPWSYKFHYGGKYRLSASRADVVIANSKSVKERIHSLYRIPDEKIEVIWLGADAEFRPLDDDNLNKRTREKYLGTNKPYILFVGGLSRRRNVPMLMRAFSTLKKQEKIPHHLLLVGPNRSGVPLAKLASELGITDCVVQTDGHFKCHTELVPIYNAADVFVLPSLTEGFSLTLAEALACGTPVITTNQAALGEVANGYALTLDEPQEDALKDAIHQVISDNALRQRLRERGLDRARGLRWDLTARRTLEVLRRVANGKADAT